MKILGPGADPNTVRVLLDDGTISIMPAPQGPWSGPEPLPPQAPLANTVPTRGDLSNLAVKTLADSRRQRAAGAAQPGESDDAYTDRILADERARAEAGRGQRALAAEKASRVRVVGPGDVPGTSVIQLDDGSTTVMDDRALPPGLSPAAAPSGLSMGTPANADLSALLSADLADPARAQYAQGPAQPGAEQTATDAVMSPPPDQAFETPAVPQMTPYGDAAAHEEAAVAALLSAEADPSLLPTPAERAAGDQFAPGQEDLAAGQGLYLDDTGQLVQLEEPVAPRRGGMRAPAPNLTFESQVRGLPASTEAAIRGMTAEEEASREGLASLQETQAAAAAAEMQANVENEMARVREFENLVVEQHDMARRRIAEVERAVEAVQNFRVNPDRFFASRGDGSRFAAAMGIAAGAMSSALLGSGTPNVAASIINAAIERDVQAQIEDASNVRAGAQGQLNLFAQMRDQFGDERQAAMALRALRLADAEARLGALAMRQEGQAAMANFEVWRSQNRARVEVLLGEMYQDAGQIGVRGAVAAAPQQVMASVFAGPVAEARAGGAVRQDVAARRAQQATARQRAGEQAADATGRPTGRPSTVEQGQAEREGVMGAQPSGPSAADERIARGMAATAEQERRLTGLDRWDAANPEPDRGSPEWADWSGRRAEAIVTTQTPAARGRRAGAAQAGRGAAPPGWSPEAAEAAGGSSSGGIPIFQRVPGGGAQQIGTVSEAQLAELRAQRRIGRDPSNPDRILLTPRPLSQEPVSLAQQQATQQQGTRRIELSDRYSARVDPSEPGLYNGLVASGSVKVVETRDYLAGVEDIEDMLSTLQAASERWDTTQPNSTNRANVEAAMNGNINNINGIMQANTINVNDWDRYREILGDPTQRANHLRDNPTYFRRLASEFRRAARRKARSIGLVLELPSDDNAGFGTSLTGRAQAADQAREADGLGSARTSAESPEQAARRRSEAASRADRRGR